MGRHPKGRHSKATDGAKGLRIAAGIARAEQVTHLFKDNEGLRGALLLFNSRRKIVNRVEIERAYPGAFSIFNHHGLLEAKGGKMYALSNAGLHLLQKFSPSI